MKDVDPGACSSSCGAQGIRWNTWRRPFCMKACPSFSVPGSLVGGLFPGSVARLPSTLWNHAMEEDLLVRDQADSPHLILVGDEVLRPFKLYYQAFSSQVV